MIERQPSGLASRVVAHLALAAALVACANPTETSRPTSVAPAAAQLALRNARCVLLAQLLTVEDVSRTCGRAPLGIEEGPAPDTAGAHCIYRFGERSAERLEVSFVGPAEAAAREARAAFAPTAPVVVPALGAHGLAFYGPKSGRNAFFFDVRGQGVRVWAGAPACEVGPLSRIARNLRERLVAGK